MPLQFRICTICSSEKVNYSNQYGLECVEFFTHAYLREYLFMISQTLILRSRRVMGSIRFDFKGENYVVTGASSGMGRQLSLELAQSGARVLAVARHEEKLCKLQAQFPNNIFAAALDVRDNEKMEHIIKSFVKVNGKLQGGVHAAGINNFTPLKTYDRELAGNIMNVSFWAGIELIRLITNSKYGNRGMSIVLFSSVCAKSSEKGMFAYAAAKSAINGCLGSLAKELCIKGDRINSIMPGWVNGSAMTSDLDGIIDQKILKKNHLLGLAEAQDVTGMVLFLLSERARWITGTSIVVDGGFLV